MRSARTLLLALLLAGCEETLGPPASKREAIFPGAVLPRAAFEDARIPFEIWPSCTYFGDLELTTQLAPGNVVVEARRLLYRNQNMQCLSEGGPYSDTLLVPTGFLRDTTVVRFRQPGGRDSIRVILLAPPTVAP